MVLVWFVTAMCGNKYQRRLTIDFTTTKPNQDCNCDHRIVQLFWQNIDLRGPLTSSMFLGNHCKFQWFWRDHCKFSMVFEETITIECFLGGLTIAINGFTMVFWCCYHRFQWFLMVPDHWSNNAMVSMDRCGLTWWLSLFSQPQFEAKMVVSKSGMLGHIQCHLDKMCHSCSLTRS